MRAVAFRERFGDRMVWTAQLLEHDLSVKGLPGTGWTAAYCAYDVVGLLDETVKNLASETLEAMRCAPAEYFDLWERSVPYTYPYYSKINTGIEVRVKPGKSCTSHNAGEFCGCSPTNFQGIAFAECYDEAMALFRHPEQPVGHYRCLRHADQDQEVFDKAGWVREDIHGPWPKPPERLAG